MAREHIAMTTVEQRRMVSDLRDHVARMTGTEQEEFEMLAKRDRDDEDLDQISKKRLLDLHERYVARSKPRANPLDSLFSLPAENDESV